ncbi:2-dehydropantoate 2-reductase [Sedimentibacter acidaminivorans]|uniref:2-dehydropantoate 2-reductase n=1 Tax=Sedimentibacter acidaminivorans TaxID=913099 RepID=A0ABS4GFM6_9FIRM|nr:2-dehydropantoate 2-reductase [Sedimentibacter acidaminivorans]MBP1926479.1 2-dehydropantoate 2-reductase [Sedimentibacter acidaminivorans]
MKICMLGSGSLGSTIGGTLAEAGNEVYLIDRWEEHVKAINDKGLLLIDGAQDNHERYIKVKAQTNYDNIGEADLVIVLVKSFATKKAIEEAKASSIIGANTLVMSLQNGLGNEEAIIEVIGKDQVIGGKTYVGGLLLEEGKVIGTTKGKYTYIGEVDGKITDRIKHIAEELTESGIMTKVLPNITGLIWDKLLINVAAGALCGVTRLPYGGLYDTYGHYVHPELKQTGLAAINEGIAVAKANGIVLSTDDAEEIWYKTSAGLPDGFKTSIQQSLEKGAATEIDYINGAVVRWGKKSNVSTPVNETLVACVKGLEFWQQNYSNK